MQAGPSQAWDTLQATGRICLEGEPASWSKALKSLVIVLLGLIGLLAVGVFVGFPVLIFTGMEVSAGSVFGFLGCLAMLTAMGSLVLHWHRVRNRYREVESLPVILDANGLTLRGVGPIPWQDFGLAEHQMVRAEHDSSYTRRAVMPLTAAGYHNVNQLLAYELRPRVSPATGSIRNRHHPNIYVPGVAGMKTSEVMWLINSARSLFTAR